MFLLTLGSLIALSAGAQVSIQKHPDRITVDVNGKAFTQLWIGPEVRKPYLHPIYSASGKIISRRYPMESVAGETRDHPHHRGLWFTHGDVNGSDFWMSDPLARSEANAKISVAKIHEVKGGKDKGTIRATFHWVDKTGVAILHEERIMTFYAEPDRRTIDFHITLDATQPVKFGDTKEGSFGLRLADGLIERNGGMMVNAEGARGEKQVWGKASPWVDYYGTLEGEKLGVAILDHPSNPRHPTYWHSRAYGLFAANIFGLHDFYNDKSKDGSLQLQKGDKLRFRYRVLIHPGDAQSADIAGEFKKFSAVK